MSARVITPPSMDINRDIGSQNCPESSAQPPVVAIPEGGEAAGLPETAGVPITTHSLGCPSPAISPNSTTMGPGTELVLSTRIRFQPKCLFGPPDPRTQSYAREKVKEQLEADKRRYNFDFEAEQPLEGPRFKWKAVQVAAPTTTATGTGSGVYAPKPYALSRFPYLSGSMVHVDRGMVSPPPIRTTINNNQLPPRPLYFQPEEERHEVREALLIARPVLSPSSTFTTTTARPVSSVVKSSSTVTLSQSNTVDPTMLLPSPEASSCSSEDSAHVDMDMELGDEEEEVATSVDSSSTEDDLKVSSNVLHHQSSAQSTILSSSSSPAAVVITHHNSSSSGLSSRIGSSSSRSSSCSTSSRRTKSVSSSSSSPSASPSSPTSSQPPITKYMPVRKRPATTSTTKAASESAPASSAASTENKRAAM